MTTLPESPLSSPPASPTRRSPLKVSDVATVFIKMRQRSPRTKAHHIVSSSGDEPQTHESLRGDPAVAKKKLPMMQEECFVCADAVDVPRLLRASRKALLEKAEYLSANVLVDERWTCTICGPRHRSDGTFKVHVRYEASAARSQIRDPGQPPSLENTKGVPGLMTILERQ